MRRCLAMLIIATALVMPGVASAQSPEPPAGAVNVTVLEALCAVNSADGEDLALCLDVVHRILVPGSGPKASPGTTAALGGDLAPVGTTLSREGLDVQLAEMDWNAPSDFIEPDAGNRFVAIRVLYTATADGGSYNPFYWSVVDPDGFSYDQAFGGREPTLQSSNDLPAGRKAQGWITFEVPEAVTELEVVESQFGGDYLRWGARR